MAPNYRLAPIDQVRPGFAAGILEDLGDHKGQSLRQQQAQDSTIHLPQTVLPSPRAPQLALPRDWVLGLVVGEQPIDEESVDDDQDERESTGDAEGVVDGDALVYGVGILEGDILEGEVLVEGFDGV
jgi:hypothetical protein